MSTPSAASTSLAPDAELAPRLPCFTTGTPAAAATMEAIDEMLSTAPYGSPPVPTMSSAIGSTGSFSALASTASRKPTISSTVSPFARRATSIPASWAEVASPAITSPMAHSASPMDRSRPSTSADRMLGQVCSVGMGRILTRTARLAARKRIGR